MIIIYSSNKELQIVHIFLQEQQKKVGLRGFSVEFSAVCVNFKSVLH